MARLKKDIVFSIFRISVFPNGNVAMQELKKHAPEAKRMIGTFYK